jgi:hypothetical protein
MLMLGILEHTQPPRSSPPADLMYRALRLARMHYWAQQLR